LAGWLAGWLWRGCVWFCEELLVRPALLDARASMSDGKKSRPQI